MKIQEAIRQANEATIDFTDREMYLYFSRKRAGIMPVRKSVVSKTFDDGKLQIVVTPNKVFVPDHEVSRPGVMWLLQDFMHNFDSSVKTAIVNGFNNREAKVFSDEKDAEKFLKKVRELLYESDVSFLKTRGKLLGFAHKEHVNMDDTRLDVFLMRDIQKDNSEKVVVVVPGINTSIYIYHVSDNRLVFSGVNRSGFQIKALKPQDIVGMADEMIDSGILKNHIATKKQYDDILVFARPQNLKTSYGLMMREKKRLASLENNA